jgi:hypothetical protein
MYQAWKLGGRLFTSQGYRFYIFLWFFFWILRIVLTMWVFFLTFYEQCCYYSIVEIINDPTVATAKKNYTFGISYFLPKHAATQYRSLLSWSVSSWVTRLPEDLYQWWANTMMINPASLYNMKQESSSCRQQQKIRTWSLYDIVATLLIKCKKKNPHATVGSLIISTIDIHLQSE